MKNSNDYESKLWKLLEKEGLTDLSQFHKPRFFDEVPLYSRDSDVAFFRNATGAQASDTLLSFALKYLRSVISYEEHDMPYFAAITVWNFSEDDPIVPNLFVWSGPIKKLEETLTLNGVTTSFGKRIKRIVSRLRLQERFEVLEERSTMSNTTRVFIAPSPIPYPGFVPLNTFRKPVTPAKQ